MRSGSIVLDGDELLRDLVLARIIEPTSKADALRVLAKTGLDSVSHPTVKRRLPVIANPTVRQALSAACAAHAGVDGSISRGPHFVTHDPNTRIEKRACFKLCVDRRQADV
jgi:hypothetical protein